MRPSKPPMSAVRPTLHAVLAVLNNVRSTDRRWRSSSMSIATAAMPAARAGGSRSAHMTCGIVATETKYASSVSRFGNRTASPSLNTAATNRSAAPQSDHSREVSGSNTAIPTTATARTHVRPMYAATRRASRPVHAPRAARRIKVTVVKGRYRPISAWPIPAGAFSLVSTRPKCSSERARQPPRGSLPQAGAAGFGARAMSAPLPAASAAKGHYSSGIVGPCCRRRRRARRGCARVCSWPPAIFRC